MAVFTMQLQQVHEFLLHSFDASGIEPVPNSDRAGVLRSFGYQCIEQGFSFTGSAGVEQGLGQ